MELEILGYFGIYLSAIVEGEVATITALQAARLGYFNFFGVLIVVFLGTISMDWFMYFVGKNKGRSLLQKHEKLATKLQKMEGYMKKYGDWLLFFYRFMYGFRFSLPLLFGISAIPVRKFIFFSLLSTTVWLSLLGFFGHHLANWMGI